MFTFGKCRGRGVTEAHRAPACQVSHPLYSDNKRQRTWGGQEGSQVHRILKHCQSYLKQKPLPWQRCVKHKTKGTKHFSNPLDATRRGQIHWERKNERERESPQITGHDPSIYCTRWRKSVVQIHYLINIYVIFFYTNDYSCVQRQKKKSKMIIKNLITKLFPDSELPNSVLQGASTQHSYLQVTG